MRYYLLPFVLLFALTTGPGPLLAQSATAARTTTLAGVSEAGLDRYTAFLEGEIEAGRLPMAEAMIYRGGKVVYHELLGKSDLETGADLREDQIFHLMSMTKPIISVAFMMLYEEGHFRLTDPVSNYLPEFAHLSVARNNQEGIAVATDTATTQVTIEQVLTHTAGFSHGLTGTKLDNEIAAQLYYLPHNDIASRVSRLSTLPLVSQPGEQWFYSTSSDILARLIEVFSGMTVIEFLEQRLLTPLGMDDTDYNIPDANTARLVTNHEFTGGTIGKAARQLPSAGNTVYGGSFGLYSTADDYLRFCRMLLNKGELDGHRYLSPKTVELMTVNHVGELRGQGQGFGLGFGIVTDVAASGTLGSEGTYYWSGAYSTYFFIDPKEDLIAIQLSQRSPYSGYHDSMFRQMVYQALAN